MNDYDSAISETTIDKKPIYHGAIFDLEQRRVALPDKTTAARDIIVHNGACAILALHEGKIAFVRQYRCAAGRVMLEIPAGKLDSKNEAPLSCAMRELREETGISAEKWMPLIDFYPSAGYSTEVIYLYLAENLSFGTTDFDDDEFIELSWIAVAEAVEMIKSGQIHDAKTVCAILLYAAKYV